MRKAGRPIDTADLPPELEWESPIWTLYARLATQWRVGFSGRYGLDYGPALDLAAAKGWDRDLTLDLLAVIEEEVLGWDANERK